VAGPIHVDIEGLGRLAQDLRSIQHQLSALGRDFGQFDSAIGARVVKTRLADVAGNWSQARQRINEQISRLADMATLAAETYRATEGRISGAVGSPRPPG
jgi:hypothetical protein